MVKLSDFLADEIYKLTKTDKFFGYIGGMVAHIVDSIYQNKNLEMINTITEQGAGFAAEGYARINNKVGIAIATSGPGATNLVTPIANCYFDSTPVLFITGQVNTYEYKKYNIKQCGFQETNIVDIVKPITKYAKLVDKPQDIKLEIQKAIHIATSGRKGPVLLDIPMDIQRADIDLKTLREFIPEKENIIIDFDTNIFKNFKRPLILAGNGVNLSDASYCLNVFLNKYNIPVVQSIHGIDTVLSNYKYNLGLIGTYGDRYGNLALYHCDLLLVLGARLDIRQTGSNIEFMKNKTIIHVDIDDDELGCDKFPKINVKSDIKDFLNHLLNQDIEFHCNNWPDLCLKLKQEFCHANKEYNKPNIILASIFNELKENDKITFDVGQNQIWAAQSLQTKKGQRAITSGGLGSMGFALPAAIGAAFPKNRVFAICGDGGMQMNIQELEVIKRRNLPVKIIILNNKSLGMVKNFQHLYFENRFASTLEDYTAPNFSDIANAYEIDSIKIDSNSFNIAKITKLINSKNPALIEILFETSSSTEPRVDFGESIANASPKIDKKYLAKIYRQFCKEKSKNLENPCSVMISMRGGVVNSKINNIVSFDKKPVLASYFCAA